MNPFKKISLSVVQKSVSLIVIFAAKQNIFHGHTDGRATHIFKILICFMTLQEGRYIKFSQTYLVMGLFFSLKTYLGRAVHSYKQIYSEAVVFHRKSIAG